jgi:hypothetical protein
MSGGSLVSSRIKLEFVRVATYGSEDYLDS